MTSDQLLLPAPRAAQLAAALTAAGLTAPLETCVTEAANEVARLTAGYVIDIASLESWTRAIARWKAYSYAGTGIPDAEQKEFENAMKELRSIAAGERPNIPRVASGPAAACGATLLRSGRPMTADDSNRIAAT